MTYAKGTEVSVEKTVAEIRKTIQRYKATGFGQFEDRSGAAITFEMAHRRVLFRLPLPSQDDKQFIRDGRNSVRTPAKRYEAWERACREKWRGLLLCIKAKLESVEAGIETFEDAFLAHIVRPDGTLVGDVVKKQIAHEYETQTMQPLLPSPKGDQ